MPSWRVWSSWPSPSSLNSPCPFSQRYSFPCGYPSSHRESLSRPLPNGWRLFWLEGWSCWQGSAYSPSFWCKPSRQPFILSDPARQAGIKPARRVARWTPCRLPRRQDRIPSSANWARRPGDSFTVAGFWVAWAELDGQVCPRSCPKGLISPWSGVRIPPLLSLKKIDAPRATPHRQAIFVGRSQRWS